MRTRELGVIQLSVALNALLSWAYIPSFIVQADVDAVRLGLFELGMMLIFFSPITLFVHGIVNSADFGKPLEEKKVIL